MKRKVLKIILLLVSVIFFFTIIVSSFELKEDFISNIWDCIARYPIVLLGLITFIIFIIMDFKDYKKAKGKVAFYKRLWKSLLLLGIVLLTSFFISGLLNAIFGVKICFLGCSDTYSYGLIAFIESMTLYVLILWPLFVIAIILIILSIIKLRKYKK